LPRRPTRRPGRSANGRRGALSGRSSTPYLESDVNVAGWLSTVERQMSSGSARPSNDGPNAPVLTGVSDGAAGIGFFFLRLNHVTRNPAYFGKARRAADYTPASPLQAHFLS
jgi:hypothetical protein